MSISLETVFKQLSKKGCLRIYHAEEEFQRLIKLVYTLAFLPEADIIKGWEEVIYRKFEQISKNWIHDIKPCKDFFTYMEVTFLGKKICQGITSYRRPPLFHAKIWNVHHRIKNDLRLTNNSPEGFHSNFTLSSVRKPNIWQTIKAFQREDALANTKFFETTHDIASSRTNKTTRLDKMKRKYKWYKSMIEDYELTRDISTFMEEMSYKM